MAGIYATLLIPTTFARDLLDSRLAGLLFGAAFVAVIIAVAMSVTRRRPDRREMWILVGVVAVYSMVLVRADLGPAERTHIFEYALVAVLAFEAIKERQEPVTGKKQVVVTALYAVALAVALGAIDEGVQAFLPNRVFDPRDLLFNSLAAVLATAPGALLTYTRISRHRSA